MGSAFHTRLLTVPLAATLMAPLALAQSSVAISAPPTPLLPKSFGSWSQGGAAPESAASLSLTAVSKQALEEDNPSRSAVANYTGPSGRALHVEAIQFEDRTGAYSAYTLVHRPDMRESKELGDLGSLGENAVLFTSGATLVLAYPVVPADAASLKPLVDVLPKPSGNKSIAPLLPTFVPSKGLVPGSIRYAVGPATYAAQGGVLPANSIGWDKSAEAITAAYNDARGRETLTLLAYPTPEIAGAHLRTVNSMIPGLGPGFAAARTRRELELVMLAGGTFAPDQAQKLIENIHMRQQLSFDKDVQPVFHVEVQKTASLLANVAVLFGVLGTAAVLLGLFLGGGRAMLRVLRGKDAATEAEFLSLHLDQQNKPASFGSGAT